MQFVHECAPSTTGRAQSDSMLRFSIALTIIFIFSLAPSMSPKIIPWAIESLSIPSDRTRPVVLGAYSWMICRRNSFHDLQCSMVKKQYFEFFRHMFFEIENLIILFDRAHRVLLRTQERCLKHLLSESDANLTYVLQTDQYHCIFLCERYRSIECYFFFRTLILDETF